MVRPQATRSSSGINSHVHRSSVLCDIVLAHHFLNATLTCVRIYICALMTKINKSINQLPASH